MIPRGAPFTIFIDAQYLAWSEEETEFWQAEPAYHWLLKKFPGGLHIKPEGGQNSQWIKLGLAFNQEPEEPLWQREGSAGFLDVMLRGAARVVPELKRYFEHLPPPLLHYGSYNSKTRETAHHRPSPHPQPSFEGRFFSLTRPPRVKFVQ